MVKKTGSSNPKRVLLVVRWPGGGIRTFMRYVYRSFDPAKWKFTIVAPESDGLEYLRSDLADLEPHFVPVTGLPTDGSSGASIFSRHVLMAIGKGTFDLVHSHGFISGACTALPAAFSKLPHLMTSHDVLNETQFVGIKGKIKKLAVSRAFAKIDQIQHVSHDAHDNFLEYFPGLKAQSIVIPNGIEVERFLKAEPRDLRGELNVGQEVFLIGFLGRFMSQKGFKYLIKAIELLREKDLPRKPLVLTFCDGCWHTHEWRTIQEKGLEDYFRFLPFTPNVAGTIKGVDVVAMPSLWEACGLVAMEALVCGCPFIGTDCIGLNEVIMNTPAYKIPKRNSEALAEVLSAEMISSRKTEFNNFIEDAARRFSVQHARDSVLKMYENLTFSH